MQEIDAYARQDPHVRQVTVSLDILAGDAGDLPRWLSGGRYPAACADQHRIA